MVVKPIPELEDGSARGKYARVSYDSSGILSAILWISYILSACDDVDSSREIADMSIRIEAGGEPSTHDGQHLIAAGEDSAQERLGL